MFSQTMEGPAQRGKIGKMENLDAPEFQSNYRMIDTRSWIITVHDNTLHMTTTSFALINMDWNAKMKKFHVR